MSTFPNLNLPPQLKGLSHYLKVGAEHETRDPVIAYWCRFHAVQQGLAIDKSSKEAMTVLMALLDWLENRKKDLRENEAISNEAVAEAHIENYVLKLFQWADSQDRAAVFNKNVVKAFYTTGILTDVLTNFNPDQLPEEFQRIRKYAKWKAAYIHNCLKNGEVPIPGPAAGGEDEDETEEGASGGDDFGQGSGFVAPNPHQYLPPPAQQPQFPQYQDPNPGPSSYAPPSIPQPAYQPQPYVDPVETSAQGANAAALLKIQDIAKAQKYCKWASSALNFDDVPTAITNLEKALRLLQTGKDDGE